MTNVTVQYFCENQHCNLLCADQNEFGYLLPLINAWIVPQETVHVLVARVDGSTWRINQ